MSPARCLVFLAGLAATGASAQTSLVPLTKAWIKDMDGDGAGDRVFLDFSQPLKALPASVEAQWNRETSAFKSATGASIAFVGTDSSRVAADYATQPFPRGLTAREIGQAPQVRLPPDQVFGGQTAPLLDSLPPILLKAVKYPGIHDPILDTLRIQVSEGLRSISDYLGLVRFAAACSDSAAAHPIEPVSQPILGPDGSGRYELLVDGGATSPKTGGCLFLNGGPQSPFTDLVGNRPSPLGVILEGSDGTTILRPAIRDHIPLEDRFRHAADGRRHPSRARHATLRAPKLITFREAKP